MAPVAEIVRMHELRMQAHAGFFDLGDPSDKRRSAAALVDLYFALLAALNPPLFIEAGARGAAVSFRVRKLFPDCRIVAFEPNPYNIEHYRQRFDYGKKRVVYEHLALADMPAELPFFVRKSVNGVSLPMVIGRNSLLKRTEPNTVYEEVQVRAVRLDDYFPPDGANNCCVWIDVEGGTGKVIAGGKRLLGQTQVPMIEVEDRPLWEDQWLATQVLEVLYPLGLVPVARDFEWWPDNYNIVCLRESLLVRPDIRLAIDQFYSNAGRSTLKPKPEPKRRNLLQHLLALFSRTRP
jgi:FkbM family methyltransferase